MSGMKSTNEPLTKSLNFARTQFAQLLNGIIIVPTSYGYYKDWIQVT